MARLRAVPETIEAEVLEIDGSPPPAPQVQEPEPAWKAMRGKVLRLDRRWWPLWVLLGVVVFAVVAVLGLLFGVVLLVTKLTGWILRPFFGSPARRGGATLSRSAR